MKMIALIPARKGSKGVPSKNKKPLNGKPLVSFSIELALQVFDPDNIVISSDDDDILEIGSDYGLSHTYKRSKELATDTSSSEDVIFDAVSYLQHLGKDVDVVVLLQPTSPFRKQKQLEKAISLYSSDVDLVQSVFVSKANPYYNLFEENNDGFLSKSKEPVVSRRQDAPIVYQANGAFYVINYTSLKRHRLINKFPKVRKYVMDDVSSLDIDTELDWQIAEHYCKSIK